MLPCDKTSRFWHLVYVFLSGSRRCGELLHSGKRWPYAKDCYARSRTLHHPVRPPNGRDRPLADGERGRCYPQWRATLFRALKASCGAAFSGYCRISAGSLTLGPGAGFLGLFDPPTYAPPPSSADGGCGV